MEENKKKEVKGTQEKKKLWETLPVRNCMLMCLAGLYILYTGYRLCKNVIDGVEGASFGFFIVGVVFLVLAVGMLYVGILAGLYILYTGYRLCKNVIDGVEGASFGFFIVGVVFLVLAVGMLYVGIRGVLADDKKQKAEAAAAKEAAKAEKAEEISETEEKQNEAEKAAKEPKEKGKMSIKDRANLAGRLAEEESEEEV